MQRVSDYLLPVVLVAVSVLSLLRWVDDRDQAKLLFEKYDQIISALTACTR